MDSDFSLLIDFEPGRRSFNALARKTFGLDFEPWYRSGYWTKQYIPYSLSRDGEVVSSVSVNFMPMTLEGSGLTMVQIGTVMTDPAFRGQGLSRFLMETVLDEWSSKVDDIYLFANDEVLDFYPRFGFRKSGEVQCTAAVSAGLPMRAEKVDMERPENRENLERAIRATRGVSRFSMNNAGLAMFHLTGPLKEHVRHDPKTGAYLVAAVEGDLLRLDDVFCEGEVDLDRAVTAFGPEIRRVVFGFSPCWNEALERTVCEEEDTTLFVLKNTIDFREKGLRFPVLSRA
jgi:GNAT superfamily N-acetyltransferase